MRTAQQETRDRTRIVSGSVSSAGINIKGTGFVVSKSATGVYTIRWTFPVRQVVNIAVTLHSSGTVIHALVDQLWSPYAFNVRTYTTAPAAVDAAFGFTATVIPR